MKKLGQILGVLIKRWTSKSPDLHTKITNIAVWGGVLLLIAAEFTPAGWITTVVTLIGGICLGVSTGTKLTTEDEEIIKETKEVFKNSDK